MKEGRTLSFPRPVDLLTDGRNENSRNTQDIEQLFMRQPSVVPAWARSYSDVRSLITDKQQ